MKKLTLKPNTVTKGEVLTRAQLKKVMGGDLGSNGSGTPGGTPKIDACKQKKAGDRCSWIYNGYEVWGYCRSYMAQPIHCSDLL